MLALAVTLALAPCRTAAAQDARPAIAVLVFENGGSYGQDKENFEALQLGVPSSLAGELARNPALRIIEHAATQRATAEQDLGARGRVDAATAAKIGKALGARYVIMGSFVDFYGKFRLNARIVDAQTGEIVRVVSNEDPRLQDRAQLFRIIQAVANRVIADLKLPPAPADAAGQARAVPTDALTAYSRGLLYEEKGDRGKAAESYRKALEIDPGYIEASEGLRRTGGA
jgi:TolB-like protein